jgi:UDP-N-acetylmuramoylalanine--D-glutamate ligase
MVKLCAEALAAGGRRAALAGNYGTGLCDIASRSGDLDWIAAEVSSFQLEKVREFRPRVGVLLNLQPNHLDRHGDMQTYAETKARLFQRMQDGDTGIVLDRIAGGVRSLCGGTNRWITFGLSESAAYRYVPGAVRVAGTGRVREDRSVSVEGTLFDNPILGHTAAAVVAAGDACGLDPAAMERAIRSFEPLPHRMQKVAEYRGVLFVNDSKATTLSAVQAALRMTPAPVRLIAGGLLKEKDLEFVKEALARKAAKVYLIGASSEDLRNAWESVVACSVCGDLGSAVQAAWADARAGETVLLSPGCASFDQFRDFEQRGERFVEHVSALQGNCSGGPPRFRLKPVHQHGLLPSGVVGVPPLGGTRQNSRAT